MTETDPNLLFIINPDSGNQKTDWRKLIKDYFDPLDYNIEIFEIPASNALKLLKEKIKSLNPRKAVAVGGDGTVKMVAEALYQTDIPLGILPGGSANGMAKELGISDDPAKALANIIDGTSKKIHLVKINGELCIHLSDIGFNAYVVKKFEDENTRGMWGYVKAAWKVLLSHPMMTVKMEINGETIYREAAMVVIANATQYGNGVVINPKGSLYDDSFEIVLIKKISLKEILKMKFTNREFDPDKTELFQVSSVNITSKHKAHFQVDGEYRGKVKTIEAELLSKALTVIVGN